VTRQAIVGNKNPNHKYQIPNKFQFPNSNVQNESPLMQFVFVWVIWLLEFGACLLFGA
jgi:hypothetical protein